MGLMVVVLGLTLNVPTIIVGCIFSMLSDLGARGLRSIPTHPMAALEFFHTVRYGNIYVLVCILCLLCAAADMVSSGSWLILFRVLALSVAMCTVLLHLSNFCLGLSSVADFSNTWARSPTSAECDSCFPA